MVAERRKDSCAAAVESESSGTVPSRAPVDDSSAAAVDDTVHHYFDSLPLATCANLASRTATGLGALWVAEWGIGWA